MEDPPPPPNPDQDWGHFRDGVKKTQGKRSGGITDSDNAKAMKLESLASVLARAHARRAHTPEPAAKLADDAMPLDEIFKPGSVYPGGDRRRADAVGDFFRGPGPYKPAPPIELPLGGWYTSDPLWKSTTASGASWIGTINEHPFGAAPPIEPEYTGNFGVRDDDDGQEEVFQNDPTWLQPPGTTGDNPNCSIS